MQYFHAETVVLTLADGTGYRVSGADSHRVTIAASDPLPSVSFQSGMSTTREVSCTHGVHVSVLPALAADLTLSYSGGGRALAGRPEPRDGRVDRWNRALAALDAAAGRGVPMTWAEARIYAGRGCGRTGSGRQRR